MFSFPETNGKNNTYKQQLAEKTLRDLLVFKGINEEFSKEFLGETLRDVSASRKHVLYTEEHIKYTAERIANGFRKRA